MFQQPFLPPFPSSAFDADSASSLLRLHALSSSSSAPSSSITRSATSPPHQLDICSLSEDQVECLCQCLENCGNFAGLALFVSRVEECHGSLADHPARDVLHRAKAVALFHRRQYGELYSFIRCRQFAIRDHPFLQKLWNEAHYAEVEQQRGRQLDPVSRYRVRKKNGFPRSIWDGEGTSYCFKRSARQILREAYRRHCMPSQEEKIHLAKKTQLSILQVSNWFKNQRQRARQQNGGNGLYRSSAELHHSDAAESEEQNIARGDEMEGEEGEGEGG